MSRWRAVWEVARRELVERSRSRVLRISVALLVIVSVGGAVAAARLSGATPTDRIAVVGGRSVALAPVIAHQARAAGRRAEIQRLASAAAAASAVRRGDVAVALVDGQRVLVKSSRTQPAVRVVLDAVAAQGVVDRLMRAGLTEAQAVSALTPQALAVDVLDPNARNIDRNRGLVVIGMLALLTTLVFFGQAVAQGVTEEKSSRVVELLLTTVPPRCLLAGKVLGIGLLGLGQLVLAGAAALIAGRLAGGAGLPAAAPETVAFVVLWFVLGYVFYSVAFAVAGALVSRQEDLQTAMLPITAVLLGAFYFALIAANSNPNGIVLSVAAFVPPFAPMVVPARVVLGDMNGLELAAAIAVDLIATTGLILLAARVYERAILQIGAPIKLRRVLARSSGSETRHAFVVTLVLRVAAVVCLLGGVAIGLHEPVAIALMAVGLALVALLEGRRHRPGPGAG